MNPRALLLVITMAGFHDLAWWAKALISSAALKLLRQEVETIDRPVSHIRTDPVTHVTHAIKFSVPSCSTSCDYK